MSPLSRLPLYNGLESANEDIFYAWMRMLASRHGLIFRVKKADTRIDSVIASMRGVAPGRCDAYLFEPAPGAPEPKLLALIELESTGRINDGVTQVQLYQRSLELARISGADRAIRVAYDGQKLAFGAAGSPLSSVLLDPATNWEAETARLVSSILPPSRVTASNDAGSDLTTLLDKVREGIRFQSGLQKYRSEVMTLLASLYGEAQKCGKEALTLKAFAEYLEREAGRNSATTIQVKLHKAWCSLALRLNAELNGNVDAGDRLTSTLQTFYEDYIPKLLAASRVHDVDLYGFFYEELAEQEEKKNEGEYYTPRHVIAPFIRHVVNRILRWTDNDLGRKKVADIFVGSGGFLYSYAQALKHRGFDETQLNTVAARCMFGADRRSVEAARLNMYLVGDGEVNLETVGTSIRWRHLKTGAISWASLAFFSKLALTAEQLASLQSQGLWENGQYTHRARLEVEAQVATLATDQPKAEYDFAHWLQSKLVTGQVRPESVPIGDLDLLLTNVPFGRIKEEDKKTLVYPGYPGRLEANALRDCVDLLRPAVLSGSGDVETKGGYAVIVVPSGILEKPQYFEARKYLFEHCRVHAVVSLPKFTFAPYTTQKTHVLVVERRAEKVEFSESLRPERMFVYISDRDGKAASDKRFPLQAIEFDSTFGWLRLHDDFGANFGLLNGVGGYQSLLEKSWSPQTPATFNQKRLTDTWNGTGWEALDGRKWAWVEVNPCATALIDDKPCPKEAQSCLEGALGRPIASTMDLVEAIALATGEKPCVRVSAKKAGSNLVKHGEVFKHLRFIATDSSTGELRYFPSEESVDVPLMPEKHLIQRGSPFAALEEGREPLFLADDFVVRLGTGITELEAYNNVGSVPVYTAAISGPAYFVSRDLAASKTLESGPALVWSRLGRAGTLTLIEAGEFFTSDKSGVIKARLDKAGQWDLRFLGAYLSDKLKTWVTSEENIGQLNTEHVMSTRICRIPLSVQRAWVAANFNRNG